jgi:hypothetical protein
LKGLSIIDLPEDLNIQRKLKKCKPLKEHYNEVNEVNTSLLINTDTQNNNDDNDSIADNNFDVPLIKNIETDLKIK